MYPFKQIEEKITENWKKNKKKIKKTLEYDSKKKLFSFLEGPPTANAPPALHHVEVRVFKDLFCRFKYMQGFTVPRIGGWDCHGLPVEVQVEKALKLNSKKDILKYGVNNFIVKCKNSVFSYIKEWNKMTEKMAYWIDLENAYATLNDDYIESVWWSLKELYEKKLLYEGHKVVPYCPRCETSLSSHEVAQGYKAVKDPSVVVKFKLKNKERYILAFTTTPWTLPSNMALAVNKDVNYVVVKKENEEYIIAKELVAKYFENPKIIEEFKGEKLLKERYEPLFNYFKNLEKEAFFVIHGDFVSTTEGTGVVHIAPGFGEDDFEAGKKNKLPLVQPITEDGKLTDEITDFKGLFVKDADYKIIGWLRDKGKLFKKENYLHDYPFCWRCDTPLIYHARVSWFIRVTSMKKKLIELNKKINWYPNHIKEGRFGDWLNNLKDWALSRKKFWGTPLPIWRCKCGSEICVGSRKELRELSGLKKDIELHKPMIDEVKIKCNKCKNDMKRVDDVIDCWYDSGSASFAQLHYPFENKQFFEKRFPYDFIAEAIDQTRGWFYTLYALATLLFDNIAYKNVVCAGHLVDEKNEKMSKSKGNIIDPWEMFDTVGVDATRLQFCTTEPGDQKRFSVNLVNQQVLPFLNILWNCQMFAKNNCKENKKVKLNIEDKWIIECTNKLIKEVTDALEKHNYNICLSKFVQFVNEDFSRTYIKLVRDRVNNKDLAVGHVFHYIFDKVLRLLAPFAPYLSDYLYQKLIKKESVHFQEWPQSEKIDIRLINDMEIAKIIIQEILSERAKVEINMRWPLSHAIVYISSGAHVAGGIRCKLDSYGKLSEIKEAISKLEDLILAQTNIKGLILDESKSGEFAVKLDTKITPELEKEGYLREVTRKIQDLRKKAGLNKEDKIKLFINSKYDLKAFADEIKAKCGVKTLTFGELKNTEHSVKEKIKDHEFVIGF
ncbi:MAG TPA: isoleucine--tRNA ligase [Candidatus Nanoarchaeia archaeon]|nr:isoleucine--tRNA ligase [Candidatus Nanoarchaeia archaeon]